MTSSFLYETIFYLWSDLTRISDGNIRYDMTDVPADHDV